jgi:ESS family glutamate:Na+ symporter
MNFSWQIFIDLGLISVALLLATLIRARVRFFQKFLIPNSLTAGFILLPFYNFLAPRLGLGTSGLENLVYHLLSISFISMSLRKSPGKGAGRRIFSTSVAIISQYTLQALVGFGLTFLFIATILPRLFPTFGFFIPLGFALGPGQAFAIGTGWEVPRFGFEGGGSIGLTFAAVGFLWACFGGVFLINLGIRRGWMKKDQIERFHAKGARVGVLDARTERPVGSRLTTETEAIDTLSYNLGAVLGVYLLSYLLLKGLTALLSLAGQAGMDLAVNLWGISFVFAAMTALLVRKIFSLAKIDFTLDNGSLNRICGVAVDLMVAGSIAAISLVVVSRYWLPILTMGVAGGLVAIFGILALTSRMFDDHQFYRAMMIYGACTGTLTTGLALLRVLDPDFETPVAADYMYASGLTFLLVIPLILMINFPAYGYASGNSFWYWLTLAFLGAYLVFVLLAYALLSRGRAFRNSFLFYRETPDHR